METILKILYFLVYNDSQYQVGNNRAELLGIRESGGQILQDTLLIVVPVAIVIAAVYYLLLNRTLKMNGLFAWFCVLIVVGAIAFQTSFTFLVNHLYSNMSPLDSLGWKFVAHTVVLSVLVFYLSSLLFKRWSINAKHTPH